jgi:hypothetical protein
LTCEKGTFCKIHPPGKCLHGNYDYTFCDIPLSESFYVEEVHFVCPPYMKQNEQKGDLTAVPQLVTYEWGTISSRSKRSVPGAERIKSLIDRTGRHVLCRMGVIGKTNFGIIVCVVLPLEENV